MILLSPFETIILIITLITFIVFSLVLVFKKEPKQSLKIIWLLLIILIPVLGSLIYYIKVLVDSTIKAHNKGS